MSEQARDELAEAAQSVRSSVKLETNAKGIVQVKVSAYEGTTREAMQEAKDIATETYLATVRELRARGVDVASSAQ